MAILSHQQWSLPIDHSPEEAPALNRIDMALLAAATNKVGW